MSQRRRRAPGLPGVSGGLDTQQPARFSDWRRGGAGSRRQFGFEGRDRSWSHDRVCLFASDHHPDGVHSAVSADRPGQRVTITRVCLSGFIKSLTPYARCMRSPIPDYLLEVLDSCGADGGAVADYIPELAAADPDRFGICIATVDGAVYAAGDADVEFTIQSMSKPFTYALALADRGVAAIDDRVGVEPSGEAFNEISVDPKTGRPRNAMINAGAILTHSLVGGEDSAARSERVRAGFSRFVGRDLVVDESAFSSEFETAHRNLGMAHLLKASGTLDCDPVEVVKGYTRQCSITVSCRDLAMMAATLANAGVHPQTRETLLDRSVVRQVMSVMMTCGMYDAAGDWMTDVGIPAKSGVSGGVIGALPGQVGVAVFSPRLDRHGSSVRGVEVFERLSNDMGMHLMDVAQEGRSAMRGCYQSEGDEPMTVYELQGDLRFAGAETVVRAITTGEHPTRRVALDLTRVYRLHDVGRRMLLECIRRLGQDGLRVVVIDPERTLPGTASLDSERLRVVDSLDQVIGPAARFSKSLTPGYRAATGP